ncbi:MAG: hypothetical protein BAJALOKI3v1_580018 [Promethearchaeota archaeon]|nr:MAG: hypothetical protein BAJALOKI3v1_580018 [Candidatus Lokiarchaeota archaeon]
MIDQLYQKGKAYYKSQNYEKALEIFSELKDYDEKHLIALKFLSLCYAHLEDYKNAIKTFEKGIELDENNEVFWMNLVKALFQVGNHKKLIKKARMAKQKFPNNEFFCNIIGVAYLNLNDIEKAIDSFKKALRISERSKKSWVYLCRAYNMKGVNFRYDDYKPNTEISWYFLAKELMLSEFYEDAIYACNFALKINPSFEGAFTLRNKIRDIKQQTPKLKARQKVKKKPPKGPPRKKLKVEKETSRYELYDQRMKKFQDRFKQLKSVETQEKGEEESLDKRMEEARKRLEMLKLEDSDVYFESKKQISDTDADEGEEKDYFMESKKEFDIQNLSSGQTQNEKPKPEPEIYLGNTRCELKDITFVIDGANLALYDADTNDKDDIVKGNVWRLEVLIDTMKSLGISDYLVMFDRALIYKIDEPDAYEQLLKKENFIEVTGGTQADNFILQYAKKENAYIISNDMFRDFYEVYGRDWIVEKRIAFQFVNDFLFFDKISVI